MSSWVRVSARGETHGKNRERQPQDRRGLVDDTDLLKVVIFVCASDASYETPLWTLSKADSGKQSPYSLKKKAR